MFVRHEMIAGYKMIKIRSINNTSKYISVRGFAALAGPRVISRLVAMVGSMILLSFIMLTALHILQYSILLTVLASLDMNLVPSLT